MTTPLYAAAIVGATATGKTALAEDLARATGGEIVCVDSRQLYRELEIGTGKPTPAEREALPHHLFEAWSLGETVSAGAYARRAAEVCRAIHARNRLPIFVGGSGLYLRALRGGLAAIPAVDPALRKRWQAELQVRGAPALHEQLRRDDPETAVRVKPHDAQRILRALEVVEGTGHPLSWWHAQQERANESQRWVCIEITFGAPALGERIAGRTHAMFEGGLVDETRVLRDRGLAPALRALRAVGYDEALDLIEGVIDRSEAERRTTLRTRQLAKRQRTWFRHQIEAIRLDGENGTPERLLQDARAAIPWPFEPRTD